MVGAMVQFNDWLRQLFAKTGPSGGQSPYLPHQYRSSNKARWKRKTSLHKLIRTHQQRTMVSMHQQHTVHMRTQSISAGASSMLFSLLSEPINASSNPTCCFGSSSLGTGLAKSLAKYFSSEKYSASTSLLPNLRPWRAFLALDAPSIVANSINAKPIPGALASNSALVGPSVFPPEPGIASCPLFTTARAISATGFGTGMGAIAGFGPAEPSSRAAC